MKRFCVYYRVSSDKQGRSGLGLEAQRRDIEAYLAANGTLISEFTEIESGKRHKNRPQLLAAIELCRRQRATLLIARLDRLARNVAFIASLMESGVEFVAVDMPHASRFTIHILAAVAEHERELISKRTKDALAAAKARGRKLGSPDPMRALRFANLARILRPPARHVLDLIVELRETGHSYPAIADTLNARDIRTPQGCRWYPSTARAVFLRLAPETVDPYAAMADAYYEDLKEVSRTAIPSFAPSTAGREATKQGNTPMQDLTQALRMLDTFASVGARRFDVTFLNIEGEKRGFRPQQSLMQIRNSLPQLMPGLTERQNNLVVRPSGDDVQLIQLDDLEEAALLKLCTVAHLTLCTSAGNHQAWVAVSGHRPQEEQKDLARRLRKGIGADLTASGATRLAGTLNYKIKYAPNFPTVMIVSAFPGRIATLEQLEQLGILAATEPVKISPLRVSSSTAGRTWPDYARCVAGAPPNNGKAGPDISRADFTWCLMALRRNQSIEDTAARLTELSSKAKENGERYSLKTAQNAAAAVERERTRA